MAGYTGEKRWRNGMNPNAPDGGVSELARDLCRDMLGVLERVEAGFEEMQELYVFAGSSTQGLADLLFKEDIEARKSPGVNAVITVDIDSSGSMTASTIGTAGTGYSDGNYEITRVTVAGVQGTGVLNYTVSNGSVTSVVITVGGEGYTPGTSQFVKFPLAGFVSDTAANSEELAKTLAAFNAVTALHELYQAAANEVVAPEDRLAQLRRMT
jgi:hypothetical protein